MKLKFTFLLLLLILSSLAGSAHAVVYEYSVNGAIRSSFDYLILGIKHIFPLGIDHIVFIIGLFLSSRKIKSVLLLATTFTVAHSFTLILSALQLIPANPSVIEPIIGASITAIGLENLVNKQTTKTSFILVFIFGLIHGCGFASALSESGIPENFFYSSLISFNIGIELAQIAIIAACFLLFLQWKNEIRFRKLIVVPASILIFIIGIGFALSAIQNNAVKEIPLVSKSNK